MAGSRARVESGPWPPVGKAGKQNRRRWQRRELSTCGRAKERGPVNDCSDPSGRSHLFVCSFESSSSVSSLPCVIARCPVLMVSQASRCPRPETVVGARRRVSAGWPEDAPRN